MRAANGRADVQGPMLVVLDVVRRLVERRLSELVMAGVTEHQDVSHAPATFGCLPRRDTDAGFPATWAMPGHS